MGAGEDREERKKVLSTKDSHTKMMVTFQARKEQSIRDPFSVLLFVDLLSSVSQRPKERLGL